MFSKFFSWYTGDREKTAMKIYWRFPPHLIWSFIKCPFFSLPFNRFSQLELALLVNSLCIERALCCLLFDTSWKWIPGFLSIFII
jgi:hypothetical protein